MKSTYSPLVKRLSPRNSTLPAAILLIALVGGANGCASAARKPADNATESQASTTGAPTASSDTSPAGQLTEQINNWHNLARVQDQTPFLFTEEKIHDFARSFISKACPEEKSQAAAAVSPECNRMFGAAIAEALHERYFAADPDAIQSHCRAEPLTCEDARTFEVLFREEHNAGIERSRADKLAKIDEWKAGRMTNFALEQVLHFHFELSNGELITHFPPARRPAGG